MAKSSAKVVNIPHDMNIQMPATKEHPGGRVVRLVAGVQELPEDLHDHPLLARLMEPNNLPGDSDRAQRLQEAQRKHDEAVGKASAELAQVRAECAQDENEERDELSEEWDQRQAETQARGHVFNEPHPHPETRRAIALTSSVQPVATAGLAQKPQSLEEPKKVRESLEDENTTKTRQRETTAREKKESGQESNGQNSK